MGIAADNKRKDDAHTIHHAELPFQSTQQEKIELSATKKYVQYLVSQDL